PRLSDLLLRRLHLLVNALVDELHAHVQRGVALLILHPAFGAGLGLRLRLFWLAGVSGARRRCRRGGGARRRKFRTGAGAGGKQQRQQQKRPTGRGRQAIGHDGLSWVRVRRGPRILLLRHHGRGGGRLAESGLVGRHLLHLVRGFLLLLFLGRTHLSLGHGGLPSMSRPRRVGKLAPQD